MLRNIFFAKLIFPRNLKLSFACSKEAFMKNFLDLFWLNSTASSFFKALQLRVFFQTNQVMASGPNSLFFQKLQLLSHILEKQKFLKGVLYIEKSVCKENALTYLSPNYKIPKLASY